MSSEKKAIKALLKSFKKVKSISLIDKTQKKGKTISKFLFSIETKEGKKSKLEKWMDKLEQTTKGKSRKKKAADSVKKEDVKNSQGKEKNVEEVIPVSKELKPEKPLTNSNAGKTTVEKVERQKNNKKGKGINLKKSPKSEETKAKSEPTTKAQSVKKTNSKSVAEGDNLKIIIGIGPAIERFLKEDKLDTFAKLASMTSDDIKALLLNKGGTRYNANDPSTWPAQAALAAEGKKEELRALQEKIKAENKLS